MAFGKVLSEGQVETEHIASAVSLTHETIYHHIYAINTVGGDLYKSLRCQSNRYIEDDARVAP